MTGSDVTIYQHLLQRFVKQADFNASGCFDMATRTYTTKFQAAYSLSADGIVGPVTASAILQHFSADKYVDDGAPASAMGRLYKVHVPVHKNRSIETVGTLYAANGTALYQFPARTHGHDASGPNTWPSYNSAGDGLNQFSSDGNTPTGLMDFDLNSPEGVRVFCCVLLLLLVRIVNYVFVCWRHAGVPLFSQIPRLYGPYPVNRAVVGHKGNAGFTVPHIRDGILLHTGEWPSVNPMPNSAGCIHSHPECIEAIWHILVSLGVKVHPNTGGTLPYPYEPQGLLSVECVDC